MTEQIGVSRKKTNKSNGGQSMNKSEQINELAGALAKAQSELENASKNAANPHFRSKYADLAEVLNTVRPVFSKHGLSIIQSPAYGEGIASVETTIAHASGQWISGIVSAPVSKQDAQGVGSAITYCRRYGLAAMAGIAQEDDDANAAVSGPGRTVQSAVKQATEKDLQVARETLSACQSVDELRETFKALPVHIREPLKEFATEQSKTLEGGES